ncbi:MAG: tryptophan--tRNA ligase [Candidatus Taylorbacteria bacterium RIFCSPHIGHO2_02_FULL_46_13]|uniref:Tryptophan--tRNA ligase n=1 Tax=Candidatus Taylorbacteria bacterium RIFCSPHIGHO2_02_FULL_46_13 TaxID=1802312 RepID=A0A1G2MSW3_9BACT|nr:MAG: tryptophan--tRNA ligase [Candidatus Taylorbacteria bacterium RIFCSPHIGHO2_02_FULL_46_13]
MTSNSKILLSGVKPTGRPHIGNYFGAMKIFVDMQETHECYIFVANLHALTSVRNKVELERQTLDVVIDYLAIGIDPQKTVLYKQSDVPQVTELSWIFNCITTMPYLMRAHAFKDAEAKNKEIDVGTFDYPLLMAADILIQDANIVPTGKDQKQHVEIARDTAEKFNRIFGETFVLPESYISENVAVIPGIDGQKMSKSYNNTISLFAEDTEIEKAVMSIVTDSGSGVPMHVYNIHKLFKDNDSLDKLYQEKKGKYKDLKEALADDIKTFIAPLREKRRALASDISSIKKILTEGGEKATQRAEVKMNDVRMKVGI